jgi:hypothetical protein
MMPGNITGEGAVWITSLVYFGYGRVNKVINRLIAQDESLETLPQAGAGSLVPNQNSPKALLRLAVSTTARCGFQINTSHEK